MIRITVEMWPGGSEENKRTLATADIANDGTGDRDTGNYIAKFFGKSRRAPLRASHLIGFKRSEYTVWWLVACCAVLAFQDMKKTLRRDT